MNKNTKLYAVYGTLKKGHGNHRIINHCKMLVTTKTPAIYSLYHLGGFPGIKNGGNTEVEIEVYEAPDEMTERRVDMLEGYREGGNNNLYNKELFNTEFGDAWIYVYNYEINPENIITDGKY